MKKFKRLATLACVGTMLMSQMVPAFADETSVTSNIGVENDNSEVPNGEFRVVLPTMTDSIYDFTLDPEKLLNQYNSAYNSTDTAFFAGMGDPTIASKDSTKAKLGVMEWTEISTPNLANLFSVTAGADDADAVDAAVGAVNNKYAVWAPDPDKVADAEGMWVEITDENYKNYVDIAFKSDDTLDTIALRANPKTGAYVYDGKLYEKKFREITDVNELAEYLTVADDETVSLNTEKGTLYKSAGTAGDEEALTDADTDINYTAPTALNSGVSQTGKIVNNGLAPVIVTASVNVNTDCGLEFVEEDDFSKGGDVYLALKHIDKANDANSVMYPVKTVKDAESGEVISNSVSQTFVLDGISAAGTTKYQDTVSDKDEATGSYNYRQYLNPNATPSSQDFALTVKANDSASAKLEWKNYVQQLRNGEVERPNATVVYSFSEEVLITNADRTTNPAAKVFSAEGVKYTTDAKGKITAIRQIISAEEAGYYEEGSNCGFGFAQFEGMKTVTTGDIKISTTGSDTGFANLTVKKPTQEEGGITFATSAIKADENVWVEVKVPNTDTTAPTTTYVFQIR